MATPHIEDTCEMKDVLQPTGLAGPTTGLGGGGGAAVGSGLPAGGGGEGRDPVPAGAGCLDQLPPFRQHLGQVEANSI